MNCSPAYKYSLVRNINIFLDSDIMKHREIHLPQERLILYIIQFAFQCHLYLPFQFDFANLHRFAFHSLFHLRH